MLAMNYRGPFKVRADYDMPFPEIEHPGDAIVKVLRSCICGSDLHLYHGLVPDTRVGTTFGHEFIGEVVDVGASVEKLKVGDKVMVPFNIACGKCAFAGRNFMGNVMKPIHKLPQQEEYLDIPIPPEVITEARQNM